jgi:Type IV secretion system pilin
MRTQQKSTKLYLGLLALTLAPAPSFASDQCSGLQAVSAGADCSGGSLLTNIGSIINALFIVAGAVAVIILIMGGIRYITSTGDSGRIKSAKDTILYAVIGLVVVIIAREIVGFVIGALFP